MNLSEEIYLNGFVQLKLQDSDLKKRFLEKIKDAKLGNFDHNSFQWRQKYPHSEDFRESVFRYDTSFIDILFENNIPNKIYEASNYKKLHLCHIQLRKAFPANSYMDWHRDSYYRQGQSIGAMPPSFKLIYYPLFETQEPCLKVLPGSHQRFFQHEKTDFDINSQFPEKTIYSSDDLITLFDVSLWHSAVNGTDRTGNLRVIYSYGNPNQYESKWQNKPINKEINDYYESKCS